MPVSWSKFRQKKKEAEHARVDASPDASKSEGKREAGQDADDLLFAAPHGQVQSLKRRIEQNLDIIRGNQLGEQWGPYFGFEWRHGEDEAGRPFVEGRLRL